MAAVNWASTQAALDAQLATATGPDLAIGQRIRERLNRIGTYYDSIYTPDIDAAKVRSQTETAAAVAGFNAAAGAVFSQAREACLYVESLLPPPSPPLAMLPSTFDPASKVTLDARFDRAMSLTPDADLKSMLGDYKEALRFAYGNGPPQTVLVELYDLGKPVRFDHIDPEYQHPINVRTVEKILSEQIDRANDWIALVQYP